MSGRKTPSAWEVIRKELPKWWRETRELGDQTGAVSLPDVVEAFSPQTPSEVALEAALFPVPKPARMALLGAAGALHAPEAEAAGGAKVGGKIADKVLTRAQALREARLGHAPVDDASMRQILSERYPEIGPPIDAWDPKKQKFFPSRGLYGWGSKVRRPRNP